MFPFIVSIFFPGLGQVLLSRHFKGIIMFFSYVILLDMGLLILPFILPEISPPSVTICIALAVLIYLYNLWDIFNIVYYRHRNSLKEKKTLLVKQGIIYYLKNDMVHAHKEFVRAYKLDKDDIDVIYYLSVIKDALGKTGQASYLLNKLYHLDFDKKWTH